MQGCRIRDEDFRSLGNALCSMPLLSSVGLPVNEDDPLSWGKPLLEMIVRLSALPHLARVNAPGLRLNCLADEDNLNKLVNMVESCPNLYELHLGEAKSTAMIRDKPMFKGKMLLGAASLGQALTQHGIGGCGGLHVVVCGV